MGAARDFLAETDQLFGLFFDVGMACKLARESIQRFQDEREASDASPFIVRDRPPSGIAQEDIEQSLHATTIGALKGRLADSGFDLTQTAHAVVVFVFHLWDEKYRALLAAELGQDVTDLKVDILGDLRLLRHSLIHNKGIASPNVATCKVITRFKPGDRITLGKHDIRCVIEALRTQLAPYA